EIRSNNTRLVKGEDLRKGGMAGSWGAASNVTPEQRQQGQQRFAEAVDYYFAKQYAEALAIFNELAQQFPGNAEIAKSRAQCVKALRKPPTLALEDRSRRLGGVSLDADTVRTVILDKMLHGATETVQLQAAELACKLLGIMSSQGDAENDAAAAVWLPDAEPGIASHDKQYTRQEERHETAPDTIYTSEI
ncbi:MAG: hypothetical protein KJ052_20940, partial [Candidatus Hydrogenedentes bacterium]|nr:hypothetical protein [Candidatus Hydrogenedentota bacterium]